MVQIDSKSTPLKHVPKSLTIGVVVLLLSGVMLAICYVTSLWVNDLFEPGLSRPEIQRVVDKTNKAKEQWAESGSSDYSFDLDYSSAWCRGKLSVVVKDMKIVETTGSLGGYCHVDVKELIPPGVHDWVISRANNADDCLDYFDVTFDPATGFPKEIAESSLQCTDSHVSYQFTNFRALEP